MFMCILHIYIYICAVKRSQLPLLVGGPIRLPGPSLGVLRGRPLAAPAEARAAHQEEAALRGGHELRPAPQAEGQRPLPTHRVCLESRVAGDSREAKSQHARGGVAVFLEPWVFVGPFKVIAGGLLRGVHIWEFPGMVNPKKAKGSPKEACHMGFLFREPPKWT